MKSNDQENATVVNRKRKPYTPQFKEQALERAKQGGVPKAAKDLGIAQAMLYPSRCQAAGLRLSKCITIENGFIPNWGIYHQKPLNLNQSLSAVYVKNGHDQITATSI